MKKIPTLFVRRRVTWESWYGFACGCVFMSLIASWMSGSLWFSIIVCLSLALLNFTAAATIRIRRRYEPRD